MQNFDAPGKYRVILTVIAGGLSAHNWNNPYTTMERRDRGWE